MNCWLNENSCEHIKKINETYKPSLQATLGAIGSGGIAILTFQGINKGTDTIKIASCRVGGDDYKSCKDYNDNNTKSDNLFVINVVD